MTTPDAGTGIQREPEERAEYERHLAAVRSAIAEIGFAAKWAEGTSMVLEDAIAYALEECASA